MFSQITRLATAAALGLCVLLSAPAFATEPDRGAFDAFGGQAGLQRVADLGLDNVLKDPRIKDRFKGVDIPRLKGLLAAQFCVLLNGPCQYTGLDMKQAHAGMNLHDFEFNALAEDFQTAMDTLDIPFRWQNTLLAKLAPMEHDITTAR